MWRWLLLGIGAVYVICTIGVFLRTISDERFRHRAPHYQAAVIDAAQWPMRVPRAARELWPKLVEAW